MNEKIAKIQSQLEEHFQHVDAITQVVLKGHLLIEEALERIIGKFVFHPEHMENVNLRFAQKLDVARSMSLDEQDNEMWDLAKVIKAMHRMPKPPLCYGFGTGDGSAIYQKVLKGCFWPKSATSVVKKVGVLFSSGICSRRIHPC